MIDTLWILCLICFATSLISASIAEDVWLYRKQRMWENIACVLMAFVFIFGGSAMYLTSKVCEDPNVVWDRCYRG